MVTGRVYSCYRIGFTVARFVNYCLIISDEAYNRMTVTVVDSLLVWFCNICSILLLNCCLKHCLTVFFAENCRKLTVQFISFNTSSAVIQVTGNMGCGRRRT